MATPTPTPKPTDLLESPSTNTEPFPRLDEFSFDAGDVTIKILENDEVFTGKVNSTAMMLASPVWKRFLFPPWAHGTEPVRELDFTEDDSDALLLLLKIVHLQFATLPATTFRLPLDLITDMAILCDQYNCLPLVKPWIQSPSPNWFTGLTEFADRYSKSAFDIFDPQQNYPCRALFAYRVFGMEESFDKVSVALLRRLFSQDTAGTRLYGHAPEGILVDFREPIPANILENMDEIRLLIAKELLSPLYKFVERLKEDARKRNVNCGKGLHACDSLVYGSLLQCMEREGLDSNLLDNDFGLLGRSLEDYFRSLGSILRNGIEIYPNLYSRRLEYDVHRPCASVGLNVFKDIDGVMENIPSPIMGSHRNHMVAQREALTSPEFVGAEERGKKRKAPLHEEGHSREDSWGDVLIEGSQPE